MVESVVRTKKVNDDHIFPRRKYVIAMRDPWELPQDVIELPPPPMAPTAPAPVNLLSVLLPPAMMLVIIVIFIMVADMPNPIFFFFMPLAGFGYPAANLISYRVQKKKYLQELENRKQKYVSVLDGYRNKLDALARTQREKLESEYPALPKIVSIGMSNGKHRRLWWRRPGDHDFLSLRMGLGMGPASFTVSSPRTMDQNEPLASLPLDLVQAYKQVSQLPVLLELQKVGSVAFAEKGGRGVHNLARRLVLEILIHHSPQDVQVIVFSDTQEGQERWAWLKWTPHTRAIMPGESIRKLAFTSNTIDKTLEWLVGEYDRRTKSEPGVRKKNTTQASLVVLVDDTGDIRQSADIKRLSEVGRDAGIYVLFIGGKNWPRECRSRVEISEGEFKYLESWAGETSGRRLRGDMDSASLLECERVARALAGLELSSGSSGSMLPESVRLTEVLDPPDFTLDILKQNWLKDRKSEELLQFPFGLRNGRKGLEPVVLNLLPPEPDYPGKGAYHTILVGTTGSGKSEFMKSLVLSAAYRYSPKLLNFFFMDFKGGTAFNVFKSLPQVVGVVTNLNPELVERGLSALDAEFNRRQKSFSDSNMKNIWEYNAHFTNQPMPHLLLLLDEFAEGINKFERLEGMLQKLVTIGRALGVYLLLANQQVNPAVDRLLNNVGWHIALKLARQEEMHIIDRTLQKVERTGQGYLHSQDGDIYEFQAAYSGFQVVEQDEKVNDVFNIYQVGTDGKWQILHSNVRRSSAAEQKIRKPSEQDYLIDLMKEAAGAIEPARPIYLEPLNAEIPLELAFQDSAVKRVFCQEIWEPAHTPFHIVVPVGFTDSMDECIQQSLEIDFDDQDGHLWILGAPGSGKAMSIETILLSLASTYTPEQVQFYILEYGSAGKLTEFATLPHCGAVVTGKDTVERLKRLLNYIDSEMAQRSSGAQKQSDKKPPALFLVINNFGEMRSDFPDQSDQVVKYFNGKSAGIHLIISTNSRREMFKMPIARKLVLKLPSRDDYMDALGGRVSYLPSVKADGRGFWVDGKAVECQICQPSLIMDVGTDLSDSKTIIKSMAQTWHGGRPHPIVDLPDRILLDNLLSEMPRKKKTINVPVGLSYESLEVVYIDLMKELNRWLILAPRRRGKSNFLASLAKSVHIQDAGNWQIYYLALRRSPLEWLEEIKGITIMKTQDEALAILSDALIKIKQNLPLSDREDRSRFLFLLDDLGSVFEPGRDKLAASLNDISLECVSRNEVYFVASAMREEIFSQAGTHHLVKSLKTGKTGLMISNDMSDSDFLNITIPFEYRKMTNLPVGRGFWTGSGRTIFLQTPSIAMPEDEE